MSIRAQTIFAHKERDKRKWLILLETLQIILLTSLASALLKVVPRNISVEHLPTLAASSVEYGLPSHIFLVTLRGFATKQIRMPEQNDIANIDDLIISV